ncbi:hypothetical protein RND81_12G074800 [Saponaria officinalis]
MDNQVEIQRFRSTCKTWRSLLPYPFPSIFPLTVPSPPLYSATAPALFHYIVEHTGYLISSEIHTCPSFLVFENLPGRDRDRVFSPFRLFSPQPNGKKTWPSPQKLDLQQLPIKSLFKTYYLHRSFNITNDTIGETSLVQKLVLFSHLSNSNHSARINPEFAVTEQGVDLAVVALLPNGQLALHLTRNNDWKLITPAANANCMFDDIINYDENLWGVDLDGGAFVLEDYVSLKMTQVAASPILFIQGNSYVRNPNTSEMTPLTSPFYPKGRIDLSFNQSFNRCDDSSSFKGRKRLVQASGKLYMLFPCRLLNHSSNQIKVFELNSKNQWEEVESIGNHSFFMGPGFAFSMVVTQELEGHCWRNCIFLSGVSFCRSVSANVDYPLFTEMLEPGPTIGVYSLVDNTFRKILPKDYPPIFCTHLPSSLSPKEVPPSREEILNRARQFQPYSANRGVEEMMKRAREHHSSSSPSSAKRRREEMMKTASEPRRRPR